MSVYSQFFFDSWKSLLLGATSLAVVYGVFKIFITPLFSPLRDLPGPKSTSFIFGNFREIFKADPGEVHKKWVKEYGRTLVYKGFLNSHRLMTLDPKALSHVLNHSYDWQKPEEVRSSLAEILGEGLLFAEGDVHKRQRRVMNPSFSLSYIRELTVVFHEKSQLLRDIWLTQAAENGGVYRTDVMSWLAKATLDIIGLAGFNYQFNALNPDGEENELHSAFNTIVKQSQSFTFLATLQAFVPAFRVIPTLRSRSIARAAEVMNRIGKGLVDDNKKAILATASGHGKSDSRETHIEKSSIATHDILSRLMAANMATDLSEHSRLSDEDVLAQIPTFLVAGNETTSVATSWCLYALCRDPTLQNKLRDELLSLGTDTPTMEELNSLPYLEGVVRECLRLYAPVSATVRVATKDDVLPLGAPFKDRKGILRYEIRVRKGGEITGCHSKIVDADGCLAFTLSDTLFVPILSLNTDTDIWGEDAEEFRPERWQHVPEKAAEIPSVYSGLLTFLSGPRSCIGYRFALVELKCLLFALVRSFSFELADPSMEIGKKSSIVTRPIVKSESEEGPRLPLKITPWKG